MSKVTNIQDVFLNNARVSHTPLTIFLTNGYQQKGVVVSYDGYTVLVICEGKQYLIYKHAISTIIPTKNIDFLDSEV